MKRNECVTPALLAAYLDQEKKDILNLLIPFVQYLFPHKLGEKVDRSEIRKGLKSEFGLDDIPNGVIDKILERIKKMGAISRDEKGDYVVKKKFEAAKFEQDRRNISNSIDMVNNALFEFMKKNGVSCKNVDQACKYLMNFINSYNYSICNSVIDIAQIATDTETQQDSSINFWVAKFVDREYQNNTEIFSCLKEIVKGSLAEKAITFSNTGEESSKKMENTVFYFDTKQLINILGWGNEYENQMTAELKNLIECNGGVVKTFKWHVDELHGILTKYLLSYEDRQNLSLEKFNEQDVDDALIDLYRNDLSRYLNDAGIEVQEGVDTSYNIINLDWPVNPDELKNKIKEHVKYRNDESLEHDASAIEAISLLRYGLGSNQTVENCKAVFVTGNSFLTYAVHEYFKGEKKGLNLAVLEMNLIAHLWAKYSKNKSTLPEVNLLRNVYAACCPSDEVIERFKKTFETMAADKALSPEFVKGVRLGMINGNTLADKTENNPEKVNRALVMEVEKEFTQKYIDIAKQEVKEEFDEREAAIRENEAELEKQSENLKKEAERVKREKNRNEALNIKKKQEINAKLKRAEEDAKHKSEALSAIIESDAQNKRSKFETGCKVIWTIVMILILAAAITIVIKTFNANNVIYLIAAVVMAVISIVSTVLTLKDINCFIVKIIRHFGAKIYEKEQRKQLEKYKDVA